MKSAMMFAVWALVAVEEPAVLVAVTCTRMVEPTSAALGTYVVAVAAAMSAQAAPEALHRRH